MPTIFYVLMLTAPARAAEPMLIVATGYAATRNGPAMTRPDYEKLREKAEADAREKARLLFGKKSGVRLKQKKVQAFWGQDKRGQHNLRQYFIEYEVMLPNSSDPKMARSDYIKKMAEILATRDRNPKPGFPDIDEVNDHAMRFLKGFGEEAAPALVAQIQKFPASPKSNSVPDQLSWLTRQMDLLTTLAWTRSTSAQTLDTLADVALNHKHPWIQLAAAHSLAALAAEKNADVDKIMTYVNQLLESPNMDVRHSAIEIARELTPRMDPMTNQERQKVDRWVERLINLYDRVPDRDPYPKDFQAFLKEQGVKNYKSAWGPEMGVPEPSEALMELPLSAFSEKNIKHLVRVLRARLERPGDFLDPNNDARGVITVLARLMKRMVDDPTPLLRGLAADYFGFVRDILEKGPKPAYNGRFIAAVQAIPILAPALSRDQRATLVRILGKWPEARSGEFPILKAIAPDLSSAHFALAGVVKNPEERPWKPDDPEVEKAHNEKDLFELLRMTRSTKPEVQSTALFWLADRADKPAVFFKEGEQQRIFKAIVDRANELMTSSDPAQRALGLNFVSHVPKSLTQMKEKIFQLVEAFPNGAEDHFFSPEEALFHFVDRDQLTSDAAKNEAMLDIKRIRELLRKPGMSHARRVSLIRMLERYGSLAAVAAGDLLKLLPEDPAGLPYDEKELRLGLNGDITAALKALIAMGPALANQPVAADLFRRLHEYAQLGLFSVPPWIFRDAELAVAEMKKNEIAGLVEHDRIIATDTGGEIYRAPVPEREPTTAPKPSDGHGFFEGKPKITWKIEREPTLEEMIAPKEVVVDQYVTMSDLKNAFPLAPRDHSLSTVGASSIALLGEVFRLVPGKSAEEKQAFLRKFLGKLDPAKLNLEDAAVQDFLKHIPGNSLEDRAANFDRMLGGKKKSLQDKLATVTAALRLIPSGDNLKLNERVNLYNRVRDNYFPILLAAAGSDGYFNHADVIAISRALISDREIDAGVRQRINGMSGLDFIKRLKLRGYQANFANYQTNIRAGIHGKVDAMVGAVLHAALETWGVDEGWGHSDTLTDPGRLSAASLSPVPLSKLAAKFGKPGKLDPSELIPMKDSEAFNQFMGLAGMVAFPKGIPVRKLAPLLQSGDFPTDLRIRLGQGVPLLIE